MLHCSRSSLIYFVLGVAAAISCMIYLRLTFTDLTYKTTVGVPSANAMAKPVITVGSGLAGLSAAYEALKAGAKVHMLDRAAKPGGNSIKASSGINGAGTRFQKDKNITSDDSAKFYADSARSAGARMSSQSGALGEAERKELIEMLTSQSADAVNWLTDEIGVDLTTVAQLGGHSLARTHRGTTGPPPGAAIVGALLKKLGANPDFTLTSSAEVEALMVSEDGKVTGVRYTASGETHELQGPVVFAAGGFAGDAHGLMAKHRPDLAGMPSTNDARPASHGLLADLGAEFVDMDSVQIHPTGFVDPKDRTATYKFLAAEALRGEGGILLSADGRRFVNEMERRDVTSDAIMALPRSQDEGVRQWDVTLLLDPGAAEAAGSHLGFYLFKGLMQKTKVKDLPPAVIEAVDRYAAAVAAGKDQDFGRETFGHWRLPAGEANREEEVAVGTVTPVTHFTMGGVAFNTKAQVLGQKGVPVEGVWAAGEITGGIHGDNRLGGSSLLECAIFGRIAGAEAAKNV
ncbi:FAD binding domain-containing protein [Xylaria bambusicola]|uniref:FAD binding domain-containing protein n=1 Tax=Xylaria bambusicola TaxID=326684 RepID=UPI002008662B|nr:FAD binding domain-containing protein [Xylaria bambusicola]KAI0521208.1 FAD binding domain-containing protein [Xylaria bambusicola]